MSKSIEIEIIGVDKVGDLLFEVDGEQSDGNISVKSNWEVHWKVIPGTPVISIGNITMKKSRRARTNIFKTFPPRSQNAESTHFMGIVDRNVAWFTKYEYDIIWKDSNGNDIPYDPKISVKPSISLFNLIISCFVGLFGIISFGFLWKKFTKK